MAANAAAAPAACYLCHRSEMVAAGLYTRIDFRGRVGIQLVCDTCLERAEDDARRDDDDAA